MNGSFQVISVCGEKYRNKSSTHRTTDFCLLSQSCKTIKGAKGEIKGKRNNGVGREKENQHLRVLLYETEIWVLAMGKGMSHSSKALLDARIPLL